VADAAPPPEERPVSGEPGRREHVVFGVVEARERGQPVGQPLARVVAADRAHAGGGAGRLEPGCGGDPGGPGGHDEPTPGQREIGGHGVGDEVAQGVGVGGSW
jgi:hypothetical protein